MKSLSLISGEEEITFSGSCCSSQISASVKLEGTLSALKYGVASDTGASSTNTGPLANSVSGVSSALMLLIETESSLDRLLDDTACEP